MILATILFCVVGQPAHCPVQHQFRLEAAACRHIAMLGGRAAQVPAHDGTWRAANVRIRCG